MVANSPATILTNWAQTRLSPRSRAPVRFSVEISPAETGSSYLNLDGDNVMGRVTYWASGEADIEAVDVSSGRQLHWKHVKSLNPRLLDSWFDQFMSLELQPRTQILAGATAEIVKSYVTRNSVSHSQLPDLIRGVYRALVVSSDVPPLSRTREQQPTKPPRRRPVSAKRAAA